MGPYALFSCRGCGAECRRDLDAEQLQTLSGHGVPVLDSTDTADVEQLHADDYDVMAALGVAPPADPS